MSRAKTLIIGVALAALVATGCEWNFETLDGQSNGPNGRIDDHVGGYNSAILYNGRPHAFYRDSSNGDLRHGYWNGINWAFETLDGHQDGPHGQIDAEVGKYTSAVLYNGRPHVFYRDSSNGDLRHGYWNGINWAFETLDGHQDGPHGQIDDDMGRGRNPVILYNGRPHVFYYDGGFDRLRHAYWNGVNWAFETLDGGAVGPHGRTNHPVGEYATAILYNGRPHVFYDDLSDTSLRHGYWNGVFWAFETLDGNGGPNGQTVNQVTGRQKSVVLYGGRPQVFYIDADNIYLRRARYDGSTWWFENLDGHMTGPNGQISGDVGYDPAALIYNGGPHVFYEDSDNGNLRHAWFG